MRVSDRRKRARHSRKPYPLGTIRIRWDNRRQKVRLIKVRMDGPRQHRWKLYARWWWEQHRGPVPAGKRVIHLDGNQLNDAPDNLELGTAADVCFLWHDRNPEASAANYEACRQATAETNRLRAAVRRAREWLPSKWYPVDHARRIVLNRPERQRWQVYGREYHPRPCRGSGIDAAALGWPGLDFERAALLTVLAEAGADLVASEVLERVALLRQRYGWAPQRAPRSRLFSIASALRKEGLLYSPRRGVYHIGQAAIDRRRPMCPWVPVRGVDLAGGAYASYRREEVDDVG